MLYSLFDKQIDAGGGIVSSPDGEQILMIYRRGVWDFPKGKIEIGENPATAAQREVMEETGLIAVTLGHFITHSVHSYQENDIKILKVIHWYAMTADLSQSLQAETEEDITEVCWVSKSKVDNRLRNSFVSLKLLWKYYKIGNYANEINGLS
jgi:8-oxo-dGTP pyrophosphatase MutT (NUDIX family)